MVVLMKNAHAEYNKADDCCFFCGLKGTSRRRKIYTDNYQRSFWVCVICIAEKKGIKNILQELERIPFEEKETNFFRNKAPAGVVA